MELEREILQILRHDLHKIRVPGAIPHRDALHSGLPRMADGMAAWLSRNFLKESFEDSPYRKSIVFFMRNTKSPRTLVNQHRVEVTNLFQQLDVFKLHEAILSSKLLNLYNEAQMYPYTSLKYHLLLSCGLFFNLKQGFKLKDLYLCENSHNSSPFQLIYKDSLREWSIRPNRKQDNLSKIHSSFHMSWDRRRKNYGGDFRFLEDILSSIGSWTVALAMLEDYHDYFPAEI